MSEVLAKHLVLVRHGESEGDVRRSQRDQPLSHTLRKHPRDEEETLRGHEQSRAAGQWISKYVLGASGFKTFDWQRVSPLIRTLQSAESLGLPNHWQPDPRLAERDRGAIQGMTKQQHQQLYPESFRHMVDHPFHWVPPQGESLLRVSMRFNELLDEFLASDAKSAIFMTHRDVLWAAHLPLDKVGLGQIEQINTNEIHNGYIVQYTNVNPETHEIESEGLCWKRFTTPWMDESE